MPKIKPGEPRPEYRWNFDPIIGKTIESADYDEYTGHATFKFKGGAKMEVGWTANHIQDIEASGYRYPNFRWWMYEPGRDSPFDMVVEVEPPAKKTATKKTAKKKKRG